MVTVPMSMMVTMTMPVMVTVPMSMTMRLVTVVVVPVWVVASWFVIWFLVVMMFMVVVTGFVLVIPVRHVMVVLVSLVDNVGAGEEECLAVPLRASVILWHIADGFRGANGKVRRLGREIRPFGVQSVRTFRFVAGNRLESL